ncbi:hypothetical protein MHSWG343_07350 [Candidatus Mycoplasma haematohominis]|uniref:Uncharacterized protein n=1 Tax=Candidatus Mycoplasma haematohominis TaxID=1494318 RepID=A0A478FUF9_9MOLU|nr:hypothetical protein MHSWG343_07350 [Candidatus Mycoplasma haemohominis]
MSTQAVAGAAAGAALLGGGGTLAAYAAGAFNSKDKDWQDTTFKDYAAHLNFKYIGETGTTAPGTLPTKEKIKTKIDGDSTGIGYKKSLKDNWENMKVGDVDESSKSKRPTGDVSTLFPADNNLSEKEKISEWTEEWCKAIANKKVKAKLTKNNQTEWNTNLFEGDVSWKAFKEVCLEATVNLG